jgi:uncharacterized membrane protein YccC
MSLNENGADLISRRLDLVMVGVAIAAASVSVAGLLANQPWLAVAGSVLVLGWTNLSGP